MDKFVLSILKEIDQEDQFIFKDRVKLSDLIAGLINHSMAELVPLLGMSKGTIDRRISKYLTSYFGFTNKAITWRFRLLSIVCKKYCSSCKSIFSMDNFYKDSSRSDGVSSLCKSCKKSSNSILRAKRLLRFPRWADTSEILKFYSSCPAGYEVDHIIPLCGKEVSGLHIRSNLQYLSIHDNRTKSNS